MKHEPFGNLTHLMQFRDIEDSYQELLQTARRVIRERQFSATFLAEDLWARDPIFGSLKRQPQKKAVEDVFSEWERLKNLYEKPQTDEQKEAEVLQLIRSFLFYAVERKDLYQTPLVGSQHMVQGFAFTKAHHTNST